jgi:hypothetical protein
MFKKMLVPICEKCYKKFVATKTKLSPPRQDPNMPIKEYFKLFQIYIVTLDDFIDIEAINNLFINGLSEKNKQKIGNFLSLHNVRPIDRSFTIKFVSYLEYIEELHKVFDCTNTEPKD